MGAHKSSTVISIDCILGFAHDETASGIHGVARKVNLSLFNTWHLGFHWIESTLRVLQLTTTLIFHKTVIEGHSLGCRWWEVALSPHSRAHSRWRLKCQVPCCRLVSSQIYRAIEPVSTMILPSGLHGFQSLFFMYN